jgi:hypothetical protein
MKLSKPLLALAAALIFAIGMAVGAGLMPRDVAEEIVAETVEAVADAGDDDSAPADPAE